jgi:hypothetical protein
MSMTGVNMAEATTGDRAAGIALIGAAGLSMLAMSHHPTSLRAGALIGVVHGAMILFAAMMAFGFTQFARLRGLERPAVLAGLVAYGISIFANIGAALASGFIAPALAAHAPAASHNLFDLTWAMNQALAKLGVVATGAAYLLWSLDLWRTSRPAALLGVAAGVVPAALILSGTGMHLHAAVLVYAAQVLWAALIGWLLLRGTLRDAAAPAD